MQLALSDVAAVAGEESSSLPLTDEVHEVLILLGELAAREW